MVAGRLGREHAPAAALRGRPGRGARAPASVLRTPALAGAAVSVCHGQSRGRRARPPERWHALAAAAHLAALDGVRLGRLRLAAGLASFLSGLLAAAAAFLVGVFFRGDLAGALAAGFALGAATFFAAAAAWRVAGEAAPRGRGSGGLLARRSAARGGRDERGGVWQV